MNNAIAATRASAPCEPKSGPKLSPIPTKTAKNSNTELVETTIFRRISASISIPGLLVAVLKYFRGRTHHIHLSALLIFDFDKFIVDREITILSRPHRHRMISLIRLCFQWYHRQYRSQYHSIETVKAHRQKTQNPHQRSVQFPFLLGSFPH